VCNGVDPKLIASEMHRRVDGGGAAAAKLGTRSRSALIAAYARIAGGEPGDRGA
jgi:hypothetical protein